MKIAEPGYLVISSHGITFVDFIFDMTDEEVKLSNQELEPIASRLCLEWAKGILGKDFELAKIERGIVRNHSIPEKGNLH
jgi:hypothetical protein